MADSLRISGNGQERKNRGDADNLENTLRQGEAEHRGQLLAPVRTSEKENAPD